MSGTKYEILERVCSAVLALEADEIPSLESLCAMAGLAVLEVERRYGAPAAHHLVMGLAKFPPVPVEFKS